MEEGKRLSMQQKSTLRGEELLLLGDRDRFGEKRGEKGNVQVVNFLRLHSWQEEGEGGVFSFSSGKRKRGKKKNMRATIVEKKKKKKCQSDAKGRRGTIFFLYYLDEGRKGRPPKTTPPRGGGREGRMTILFLSPSRGKESPRHGCA